MNRKLLSLFIAMMTMVFVGCSDPTTDSDTSVVETELLSITQVDGSSNSVTTTALLFTFSVDPTGLTESNITLTGATKGAFTGTGTTRKLAISNFTNQTTVIIDIKSTKDLVIHKGFGSVEVYTEIPTLTLNSVTQIDGISNSCNTTALLLTFNIDPKDLVWNNDITLTGATKSNLSNSLPGTGTSRKLEISNITVNNGETISITMENPSRDDFKFSTTTMTTVVYVWKHIGDAYQGGKIAYFLNSSDTGYVSGTPHGLIAANADTSTGIQWALPAYKDTLVTTDSLIGTGQANTTAIVNQNGTGSLYAAGLCDNYTNTNTGTGVYSDWYLPSLSELREMHKVKTEIGGFDDASYWSSSSPWASDAYALIFTGVYSAASSNTGKGTTTNNVRPVRSF